MVSVITAVFNAEKFLTYTVASVASQSKKPLEHILIDDCSTDGSLALAQELAQRYSNIRVIKQTQNLGYPSSLNQAIAEARSEYIAIIDSDDIALPDWIESVLSLIQSRPEIGSVGGGCMIITEAGKMTGSVDYCKASGDVTDLVAKGEYPLLHGGSIHKKSVLSAIGGYNPQLKSLEDNDIFLGVASLARIYHIGKPLILYRRRRASESRKTLEFSKAAGEFLHAKARLLKSGMTVPQANFMLHSKIVELQTINRLAPIKNGDYEFELAMAFESGGKKIAALGLFLVSIYKGSSSKYVFLGIMRCFIPKYAYRVLKKLLLSRRSSSYK